jgi:hypothetical protein
MNKLALTEEDNHKIAQNYPGGDHAFYHQDLEESNIADAQEWLSGGEMVGIVSEIHGGIIGYVHVENADDITTVLNLHAIDRLKTK